MEMNNVMLKDTIQFFDSIQISFAIVAIASGVGALLCLACGAENLYYAFRTTTTMIIIVIWFPALAAFIYRRKARRERPSQETPSVKPIGKHELVPMKGNLSQETLRHNLKIVKKQGTLAKELAAQMEGHLNAIKSYYAKLDQLASLSDDPVTVADIRRDFDALSTGVYAIIARAIKLSVLADLDGNAYAAAQAELSKVDEVFNKDKLNQALLDFASRRAPELSGSTSAEEIVRMKKLLDSILSGSRGDQMVSISEIYPDQPKQA